MRLKRITLRLNWPLVGFALSVFIPSTAVVQKYLGSTGAGVYFTFASLTLWIGHRYVFTRFLSKVTKKQTLWLIAVTFLILVIGFSVVYPFANSGIVGGGSDRDEALNIAAMELLKGHYPYYLKTYLGNLVSPLPGALLLAIPFVLLGNSAYQNFFWLVAFFFAMKSYLKDVRLALLLQWVLIALSPVILNEFVTGGDLLSNSLYVLLFVMWIVSSPISEPGHSIWKKIYPAILLGVGLSSRANFVLLLPLVFSFLLQGAGWKSAIKYIGITCVTFCMITIPFYVYDPQGFSPLHTVSKLSQFQSVIPFAGFAIPFATAIIALILSFQRMNHNVFFRNCAIVQAFPVLCGILLSSVKTERLDLHFAGFGLIFLFFGAAAFWPMLMKTRTKPAMAI